MNVQEVDIDRLVPMLDLRFHRDEVKDEELLRSIQEWGVRDALLARPHPDPELRAQGKLEVADGRRRLRLGLLANLSTLPVDIRDMEDEEAYSMALVKNLLRSNVSDIGVAHWLHMMQLKFAFSQDQLSLKVGKSPSWVSRMLKLWDESSAPGEKPLLVTERQSRAIRGMSEEQRERIIEQSKLRGEVPYSARELERKSKAEYTPEQVLTRYSRDYDDEFLIHMLVEDSGLTVTDAKNTLSRWKLSQIEKRQRPKLGDYTPSKNNKEVQLYNQLGKYYPLEVIDEVGKIFGIAKSLETWLKNCRRYVAKLFNKAPAEMRQALLEEFKL